MSLLLPKAGLDVAFGADDLAQVIYIDHYGNAMTGLRAASVPQQRELRVAGHTLAYARVFGEATRNEPFWYGNSIGLVELAYEQASAAQRMALRVGTSVTLL
jgi:S-adenosylmethionine hydrolase